MPSKVDWKNLMAYLAAVCPPIGSLTLVHYIYLGAEMSEYKGILDGQKYRVVNGI